MYLCVKLSKLLTWKRQLHLRMCSGLLLLGFKGHPRHRNHFWKQSISRPAAIQTSINGSDWIKQTCHMAKTAKHLESHHPSNRFVCWKWSNCANSMCCPFHKVSKIKDTGGEIRYLPKPTLISVKLHPALDLVLPSPILSALAQNRVKLSNTTRKMNFGSVCPLVSHGWPYSLPHRLYGLKWWSYNGLSHRSQLYPQIRPPRYSGEENCHQFVVHWSCTRQMANSVVTKNANDTGNRGKQRADVRRTLAFKWTHLGSAPRLLWKLRFTGPGPCHFLICRL